MVQNHQRDSSPSLPGKISPESPDENPLELPIAISLKYLNLHRPITIELVIYIYRRNEQAFATKCLVTIGFASVLYISSRPKLLWVWVKVNQSHFPLIVSISGPGHSPSESRLLKKPISPCQHVYWVWPAYSSLGFSCPASASPSTPNVQLSRHVIWK